MYNRLSRSEEVGMRLTSLVLLIAVFFGVARVILSWTDRRQPPELDGR